MQRRTGFTLIELIVVLSIVGTLLALALPNMRLFQNYARVTAVKLNMRHVAQAIATFFAENGYYADDFYEDGYGYIFDGGVRDERLGSFPVNPYTGKEMQPDEFNTDMYDQIEDVSNTAAHGPNDEWGYAPGEMRYATFTPAGQYHPTAWGLIGFEHHGLSIRSINEDGDVVIYVLHE